jgi:hypothetical protein
VKKQTKPKQLSYYIKEEDGHYYVYHVHFGPVFTMFDVVKTSEQAKQAIRDHKQGKHATQWRPEE